MMKGGGLFDQDFSKAQKQLKQKDSLLTGEEEFIGLSKETLDILTADRDINTVQTQKDKLQLNETRSLLDAVSKPRRGLL